MTRFVSLARLRSKAAGLISKPALRQITPGASPDISFCASPPLAEDALSIDPDKVFSPDAALIESYTRFDPADHANIEHQTAEKLLYRGIPYSRYLDEWQFHPGRIGSYLVTQRMAEVVRLARALQDFFVELPNGGLALYYPNTIQTARLQSNEYIYSGIAQGQLLAGYTRLILRDRERAPLWRDLAARIAESMRFPFEDGGVCLDGQVILEAPNFRSCPEIILNGWTDALIHLHDYLQVAPDKDIEGFYLRNLDALAALLTTFDDPGAQLSRYSNLCPYVFCAQYERPQRASAAPRVIVEYLPAKPGYRAYRIEELWKLEARKPCLYDNRIEAVRSSSVDLRLSVSSLHDLRFHIAAPCSRVSFDPGTYDNTSTVPKKTMTSRSVAPIARSDDGFTTFHINAAAQGLLAGCPTNFMKHGKENFYHPYHIVALYELALSTPLPPQRKALAEMASLWLGYMESDAHKRLGDRIVFASLEGFVRKMNRFRAIPSVQSFKELRERATS